MTTVQKWEYLTAWRRMGTKSIKGKGFMGGDKRINIEALVAFGDTEEEDGDLIIKLNQLGDQGWELVSETAAFRSTDPHVGDEFQLLFKRPVEAVSPYLVAAA